ncbi:MAG: retron St85 family effector protein [Burkholderiales bacterium]|jgi:hypothetical protein|uniref:retron St85 family effector protein n=1 Tax=Limnobacter sp. TaxID=2003368 RepID=UPI0039BCB9E9|nr:retron St85 family effector protein [Burkholderiales bacterium]
MREFIHKNSAIGKRITEFGLACMASPPYLSRNKQLIFLCGANRAPDLPSYRREAIKRYIQNISENNSVIYAESVLNELIKIGHQKNALDLEHDISDLADKIIIVLESESTFCELGAFAHPKLREKLIVINNSKFKGSESFINTGPIAAMREVKSPVLWYPMSDSIRSTVDGIGATFAELKQALIPPSRKTSPLAREEISQLKIDRASLYFVHDLVFFAGPITNGELVDFLKTAFGEKSYDPLSRLLGILRAGGLINSNLISDNKWIYRTVSKLPFLDYKTNTSSLMSTCRHFHLKNNPERFSLV